MKHSVECGLVTGVGRFLGTVNSLWVYKLVTLLALFEWWRVYFVDFAFYGIRVYFGWIRYYFSFRSSQIWIGSTNELHFTLICSNWIGTCLCQHSRKRVEWKEKKGWFNWEKSFVFTPQIGKSSLLGLLF